MYYPVLLFFMFVIVFMSPAHYSFLHIVVSVVMKPAFCLVITHENRARLMYSIRFICTSSETRIDMLMHVAEMICIIK